MLYAISYSNIATECRMCYTHEHWTLNIHSPSIISMCAMAQISTTCTHFTGKNKRRPIFFMFATTYILNGFWFHRFLVIVMTLCVRSFENVFISSTTKKCPKKIDKKNDWKSQRGRLSVYKHIHKAYTHTWDTIEGLLEWWYIHAYICTLTH